MVLLNPLTKARNHKMREVGHINVADFFRLLRQSITLDVSRALKDSLLPPLFSATNGLTAVNIVRTTFQLP
jgi:hypothetical protein